MARRCIIIIGHGSRVEKSNAHFRELVQIFSDKFSGETIVQAYIELARPSMSEVLDEYAKKNDELIIFPLLLLRAGHAKKDIPDLLTKMRVKYPAVKFTITDVLGLHTGMLELLGIRASDVLSLGDEKIKKTGVILIGRGSSDSETTDEFKQLLYLFKEKHDFSEVFSAYISVASPSIREAFEIMAKNKPERILLLPYILFSGVLSKGIEAMQNEFNEKFPDIETVLASPLGIHSKLIEVMEDRITEVLDGNLK